jgi:ankyrin repeat protein
MFRSKQTTPVSAADYLDAASTGNIAIVQRYIAENKNQAAKINVTESNSSQDTALICAALNGHDKIVKFLLTVPEININTKNYFGETALLEAAKSGHIAVVQTLLDHGADATIVDCENKSPITHAKNETIRRLLQETLLFTTANRLELAKIRRNKKVKNTNLTGVTNSVLESTSSDIQFLMAQLHEVENFTLLPTLVNTFSDLIIAVDSQKRLDTNTTNQLKVAAYNGRQAAKHIIKHFTDPTPAADDTQNESTLTSREATADVNKTIISIDEYLTAASNNELDIVRTFISQNKNNHSAINAIDIVENTALMKAIQAGNVRIARFLLSIPGIDIDAVNMLGDTALIEAIESNQVSVAILLINKSANIHHENGAGKNALMCAVMQGNHSLVKLLLQNDNIKINVRDSENRTPLIMAALHNHYEITRDLLAYPGIDIDAKDDNDRTAANYAGICEHLQVLALLLAAGANTLFSPYERIPTETRLSISTTYSNNVNLFITTERRNDAALLSDLIRLRNRQAKLYLANKDVDGIQNLIDISMESACDNIAFLATHAASLNTSQFAKLITELVNLLNVFANGGIPNTYTRELLRAAAMLGDDIAHHIISHFHEPVKKARDRIATNATYPAALCMFGARSNKVTGPKAVQALRKMQENAETRKMAPFAARQFFYWAKQHNRHFDSAAMKEVKQMAMIHR